MLHLIKLAARNLRQHRRGTLLVGAACGGLALVLTLTFSFLQANQRNIYDTAIALMTGDFNVMGVYKYHPYRAIQLLPDPDEVEQVVRSVPGLDVDYITRRTTAVVTLRTNHRVLRHDQLALGVDVEREMGLRRVWQFAKGSMDGLAQPDTVVLSTQQAKDLNVTVGDVVTLVTMTATRNYNTVDAKVVGIAQPLGSVSSMVMVLPNSSLRKLLAYGPKAISSLQIHLRSQHDDDALKDERAKVRTALATHWTTLDEDTTSWFDGKQDRLQNEPWTGARLDVTGWQDEVRFQSDLITGLELLTGFLAFVFLLIVSAGLFNSLWLAVWSRTQEIGALRAIGMQPRQVIWMLLAEGVLLAFSSALLGAIVAGGLSYVLNAAKIPIPSDIQFFLGTGRYLQIFTTPLTLVEVVAPLSAIAGLASLGPAILASRLRPILALNHTR